MYQSESESGFDYYAFKRETLAAAGAVGVSVHPSAITWLSADQRAKLKGRNFVTNERWQLRSLANRTILVELSYGWMFGAPLLGLTVFHKGESSAWDDERSKCCHSIAELVEALELLDAGREAIA